MAVTVALSPEDSPRASLREYVAEHYEDGDENRQVAKKALAKLQKDEALDLIAYAALRHLVDVAAMCEADRWREARNEPYVAPKGSETRSPAQKLRSMGILAVSVSFNDGTSLAQIAEADAKVCARLSGEYAGRRVANAAGEEFWKACERELRKAKVETLKELGVERVEAIRERTAYRVGR